MPIDYRHELMTLRAQYGALKTAHDVLVTDKARLANDAKYFSSKMLKFKRSNMLLAAAFSGKAAAVNAIESKSMWMKETGVLELQMARWDVKDHVELMLRYLYRARDADGTRLFHSLPLVLARMVKPGNLFDEISRAWNHVRDLQVAAQLKEIYSPAVADALRLCCRISWNKLRWCRDTFRWDWTATDKDGTLRKERRTVAPGSAVRLPDFFPLKEMRAEEEKSVGGENGNVAHADGRGVEVANVDVALLRMVTQVQEAKLAGGFATAGTDVDPHLIVLTGDGAGLTADDSGVDIAAIPGSVQQLNQSTHLVHRLALWRATSLAEHHDTIRLRAARIRPGLMRIFRSGGELLRADGSRSGVFVKFCLVGDKPWLCHVLGRRSFGHDFFSPHCKCSEKAHQLYAFNFDPTTHFDGLTFEERCNLALVPLWEALDQPEPETWFIKRKDKVCCTLTSDQNAACSIH